MKHYGKLIHPRTQLTTEVIKTEATGITKEGRYYRCLQCESNEPQHFYQYYSSTLSKMIVYCRNCISLGRIDDITIYKITESFQNPSPAYYNLPFELSAQQAYASEHIVQAIQNRQTILLYAVTGAGKTEMMFQGIQYARRQGDNIAVVSPRVDVVVEISKRIQDAFKGENIDVLHQQSQQQFNGHFVVSTVHQLYRFKKHFDTIFVDEVDAFPLAMNNTLQQALISSAKEIHTMTYMTATPPKHLLATIPRENIIKLPARFHKKSLPVPKFQYFKLKESKIQYSLYKLLIEQISNKRYTLVFFNNIDIMIKTFSTYKNKISRLTYVHSEDVFRFEKVENLRNGNYDVIFTTTILERGFTMANLDVVVIDAHQFSKEALIQIAGRVGRKLDCPKGKVLYFHQGVSLSMMLARKEISQMNRLALKRRWIDE